MNLERGRRGDEIHEVLETYCEEERTLALAPSVAPPVTLSARALTESILVCFCFLLSRYQVKIEQIEGKK